MTLILIQWSIQDYGGISVTGRGPDHIGFKVEDCAKVQGEIEGYSTHFAPGNAPMWLLNTVNRTTDENQIRVQDGRRLQPGQSVPVHGPGRGVRRCDQRQVVRRLSFIIQASGF